MDRIIRITVKSYDKESIERSIQRVMQAVVPTAARIKGPVALPTKRQIIAFPTSPHANKSTSGEKFACQIHHRFLDLQISPGSNVIDELLKIEIQAGVDVDIKQI